MFFLLRYKPKLLLLNFTCFPLSGGYLGMGWNFPSFPHLDPPMIVSHYGIDKVLSIVIINT